MATVDVAVAKLLKPLMDALRGEGFAVEAACAEGPYARSLREEGYLVHPIPFARSIISVTHPVALWRAYRLLRQRSYDVVHVHTPVAQVIGRIAARLARIPIVVYTSHGFQFHESRSSLLRWAIFFLERWLGRWTTTFLFTQSREDAETALTASFVPPSRLLWIGNGVDVARFGLPGRRDQARQALGLSPQDLVVGFVGRIVREKGVLELVHAMALVRAVLPAARLLMVGDTLSSDGDIDVKKHLRESIDGHRLNDAVLFAGFRDDIPDILPAMDLFVLPSWREGMPRSVIEAMASRLPVVATDIRGCREEVVHGETGLLVPPREPSALAEAILRILCDPVTASTMGAAGRRRAEALFDEQVVIGKQLAIFRELLNGHRWQH